MQSIIENKVLETSRNIRTIERVRYDCVLILGWFLFYFYFQ